VRLSGRRRQAISPDAANEPATSVTTTSSHWIGASRSNSTGLSASSSATTTAIQRPIQKPGRCAPTANRLLSGARLRT